MRPIIALILLAAAANASSWFGQDDPQPTPWTQEQVAKAQKVFENVKDDSFDAWNESRLRQWLMDQGVIEPKGTREQLAQMARKQYQAYASAVSSLSASASTAIYGDSYYQATQSISSFAAQSTDSLLEAFDDAKDYVYSSWDDNQLRTWLEERGYIRTHAQVTRDEMLQKMKETYAATADPAYAAWSDSYMRAWLVKHGVLSDPPSTRDKLVGYLNKYYYSAKDYVWTSWTDSELHAWLVQHNIIKSDAQVQREKMLKLVQDNYTSASNAVWDAWTESEMRQWLIDHGYMRSNAQVKRDEMKALINAKYTDVSQRTAEYLTWPDARLRAYLRMHGLPESQLPTTRPGLLHEVRIRYVIAQNKIDSMMQRIRDTVSSSIETAEETLGHILEMLTGAKEDAAKKRDQYVAEAEKRKDRYFDEATKQKDKVVREAEKKAKEAQKQADKLKSEL